MTIRPTAQEVSTFHSSSDVDFDKVSQHHTLGIGPNQAAPGNHKHDDTYEDLIDNGVLSLAPGSKFVAQGAASLTGCRLISPYSLLCYFSLTNTVSAVVAGDVLVTVPAGYPSLITLLGTISNANSPATFYRAHFNSGGLNYIIQEGAPLNSILRGWFIIPINKV